jgi:hypothetical protein
VCVRARGTTRQIRTSQATAAALTSGRYSELADCSALLGTFGSVFDPSEEFETSRWAAIAKKRSRLGFREFNNPILGHLAAYHAPAFARKL